MTSDDTDTHIQQFNWDETTPSAAVVAAVAEVTGEQPTEMKALHHSVDTDALDSLFADSRSVVSSMELSFEFADTTVTVCSDGCIRTVPET